MSKFEKRLIVAALVFVAIYLGAAAITIHTLIAELFLPFMILFTLSICFIIVRKQRVKKLREMEKEEAAEEDVLRKIE